MARSLRTMKIKKSNKKKIIISTVVIIVTLAVGYLTFAYMSSLWPFQKERSEKSTPYTNKTAAPNSNKKPATGSRKEVAEGSNTDNDTIDNSVDNSQAHQPDEKGAYINPPLLDPPSTADPYPIENERYSITQSSPNNFQVTLYPVVNNPEYSSYREQLKAYKNEVINYLSKRHGDINKLTIEWRPSDAQNI